MHEQAIKVLDQAFELLDSGKTMEAYSLFEKVTDLDSNNPEAWKMLAAILGEMGDVGDAIKKIEKSISLYPSDPDAFLIKANLLVHANRLTDAIEASENTIRLDPECAECWSLLGSIQGKLQRYAESEISLRKALEIDPSLSAAQSNLATLLSEKDSTPESIDNYLKLLQSNPKSFEILLNLALAYQKQQKFDDAIDYFEKALKINQNATAICGLSDALLAIQCGEESKIYIEDYLEVHPDDVIVKTYYANLLLLRQEITEAINVLQQVIQAQPDYAEAHYRMALAKEKINDYPAAIDAYRDAIKYDPGLVFAHFGLAVRLIDSGDYEGGVKSYNDALNLQPNMHQAMQGLAIHYLDKDQPGLALNYLQQARECQPDSAELYSIIAKAYFDLGDYDNCLKSHKHAIEIEPDNVDIFHNYALAEHLCGDTVKAIELLEDYQSRHGPSTGLMGLQVSLLAHEGDDRAKYILDLDSMVMMTRIEPAEGFESDLEFIGELCKAVLHHPSLIPSPHSHATRHGGHTGNLFINDNSIFAMLEKQVRERFLEYLNALSLKPDHPLYQMLTPNVRSVAWGVVMDSQGHQIPHIHPSALISGVCYLQLPEIISDDHPDKAGWLEFGPALEEFACDTSSIGRLIKPEIGKMILFPSYAFHNTIPFESDKQRISLAFDIIAS